MKRSLILDFRFLALPLYLRFLGLTLVRAK